MAVTGRQLLDFVNAHGENEVGVCVCSHWWEEHHDHTCDACLDNAADQDDPHAVADHAFVFSDECTAESEYLTTRAFELGSPFEPDPEGYPTAAKPEQGIPSDDGMPDDAWFITQAVRDYEEEGSIEIDRDRPVVSRGDEGAYVKAWVFVEAPRCDPGKT